MATEALPRGSALPAPTADRVLLIWQNPVNRAFRRVGELNMLEDGRYAFRYRGGARDPEFYPLAEFPDVEAVYVSSELPAFFGNRVMSRHRDSYSDFCRWVGLSEPGADTPFEVLIRTGGPRATDTFHVVDDLRDAADGRVLSRFLASGVRHIAGATERLAHMAPGTRLELREDHENPVNPRALLIDTVDGEPVAYIPDWLVEDVHRLRECAERLDVVAEQINTDAPPHLRLLCRLEATVP